MTLNPFGFEAKFVDVFLKKEIEMQLLITCMGRFVFYLSLYSPISIELRFLTFSNMQNHMNVFAAHQTCHYEVEKILSLITQYNQNGQLIQGNG